MSVTVTTPNRPLVAVGHARCWLALLAGVLLATHGYAQSLPRELTNRPDATRRPPSQRRPPALDSTGWRFVSFPRAEAIDEHSGEIRFRVTVTETGAIESLTPVFSSVSVAQEQACRAALLASRFEFIGQQPRRATGFYTFRFSIR